jgi:hypothetical protein
MFHRSGTRAVVQARNATASVAFAISLALGALSQLVPFTFMVKVEAIGSHGLIVVSAGLVLVSISFAYGSCLTSRRSLVLAPIRVGRQIGRS